MQERTDSTLPTDPSPESGAATQAGSVPIVGSRAATPEVSYPHAIKETLTAIIIAFALAFVFRGFVMEAFLIPTGSMAPTLRGAHVQFMSPQTGYDWAAGPRDTRADGVTPLPVQAMRKMSPVEPEVPMEEFPPLEPRDPMSQWQMREYNVPTLWGDRIFVMKYLYSVYDPARFDVVVFRNPREPTINYIKRLVGLPGEMVALIDGDVFARKPGEHDAEDANTWKLPGWSIQRKPERAQRAMWQPLFSSEYQPLSAEVEGQRWFISPWVPVGTGPRGDDWSIEGRADYEYTGPGPTRLMWDTRRRPIDDSYAYNETGLVGNGEFPVSDIRLSLGVRPKVEGEEVSAVVQARAHQFKASVSGGGAVLSMRGREGEGWAEWKEVARAAAPGAMRAGEVTNVDFWHVDQSLQLWSDNRLLVRYDYEWTPEERVRYALSMNLDQVAGGANSLTYSDNYTTPEAWFEFSGGPFTAYRVALARDIHYQADVYKNQNESDAAHSRAFTPALATHPTAPLALNGAQYFVCGDNSPQSLDARLWDKPHPWVQRIDPTVGVVNRDLLIGKAFFVYFPSPYRTGRVPVPDVGRVRFIW